MAGSTYVVGRKMELPNPHAVACYWSIKVHQYHCEDTWIEGLAAS
jgi:hypothetical protein